MSKEKRKISSFDNSGILRKKTDADGELLIFGYASKLFRDDEKALEIDQGKHLIPWNGMESVKVDRYDARGHLIELSQFESSSHDHVPTIEEREFEQMCDKERYYALENNEEEHLMYQEEEFKRMKHSLSNKEYGLVSYQYTEEIEAPSTKTESAELEPQPEDLEPYVPSPLLDITEQLVLPTTKKENQIIEKTASYIALHGPQVEIIVKTRQANNEKLSFMHAGNPLNPFYNFILNKIKNGEYRPGADRQTHEDMDVHDDCLHPILSSSTPMESAPSIPNIDYKPSGFSSYDLLVRNIKNVQQTHVDTSSVATKKGLPFMNHTKNDKQSSKSSRDKKLTTVTNVPSVDPPPNIKEIITKLFNFSQAMGLHPSELATNLLMKSSKKMEFLMPEHPYHSYYKEQLAMLVKENAGVRVPDVLSEQLVSSSRYDCESEGTHTSSGLTEIRTMEEDNCLQSESSVSWFASYNSQGIGFCPQPTIAANEQPLVSSDNDVPNKPTQRPVPVCFEIKKNKEDKLEIPTALPVEESSEEDENREKKEKKKPENPKVVEKKTKFQVYHESEDESDKIHEEDREGRKRDNKSWKSSQSNVNSSGSSKSYENLKSNKLHSKSMVNNSEDKYSKTSICSADSLQERKKKRDSSAQVNAPLQRPPKKASQLPHPSAVSPPPRSEVYKIKKEQRRKRAKELVDRLKKVSNDVEEETNQRKNKQCSGSPSLSLVQSFLPVPSTSFTSFLPQGPVTCLDEKECRAETEKWKNVEDDLREKVKRSLKKFTKTMIVLPPFQNSGSRETSVPLDKEALKTDKSISQNDKLLVNRLRMPTFQSRKEYTKNENQLGSSPLFRPSTSENSTAESLGAMAYTRLKPNITKICGRSSEDSSTFIRYLSSDSEDSSSLDSSSRGNYQRCQGKSSSWKYNKRRKKCMKHSKKSKKSDKKGTQLQKQCCSSRSSSSDPS